MTTKQQTIEKYLTNINSFVFQNHELCNRLSYIIDIEKKIEDFLKQIDLTFYNFSNTKKLIHIIYYVYACFSKVLQLTKMQKNNIEESKQERIENKLVVTNDLLNNLLVWFFDISLAEEQHHDILITGIRKFNNITQRGLGRFLEKNKFDKFVNYVIDKIFILGFRDLLNIFTSSKFGGNRYLLNRISNIIQTTDLGIKTHSAVSTKSPYKLFSEPYQTEVVYTKNIRDITKDQFRRYFNNVKMFYVPDDKIDLFYVYMICSISKINKDQFLEIIYQEFAERFVEQTIDKSDTFVIFINDYNSIDYDTKWSLDLISVNVEDMKQIYITFNFWAKGELAPITNIRVREEGFFEIETDDDRLKLEDIENYQEELERELREEYERELREEYEDENR